MLTKKALLVVFCSLVFPICPLLYGQATSSFSGTVTDKSGSVVAGASVKATAQATGISREARTDDSGHYLIPLLSVGNYTVRVDSQGFQSAEQKDLRLQVDERRELDFTLSPASVATTVEVSATQVAVESSNPTLGQVITAEQVANLPLNGRDFVQLATLTPGTTQETNPNSFSNGGPSSEVATRGTFSLSVGGSRANSTDWLFDGVDNNELTSGGIGILPSIDAIQEFKVLTYNYSAEYGTRAGPTVLITTKSGTNQFHGSLFEFFRNTKLDARSYFASSREQFNLNEFGGAGGGPIQKDKTFIFVDYQAKRQRHGEPFLGLIPTQAMVNGDFTEDPLGGTRGVTSYNGTVFPNLLNPYTFSPFQCDGAGNPIAPNPDGSQVAGAAACNKIPAAMIDPTGQAMMKLYPLTNSINTSTLTNFASVPVRSLNEGEFDGRLDHTFSSKDSIFARFSYDQAVSFIPGGSPGFAAPSPFASSQNITNHGRNVAISETHIFSDHNLNQLTVGFNRIFNHIKSFGDSTCEAANLGIQGADINSKCAGAPPGLSQSTKDCMSCGLTATLMGSYWGLGDRGFAPFQGGTNVFSIADSFDMIRGKHDIRVGGGIRAMQMNVETNAFQDGFLINFGLTQDGAADLLLGQLGAGVHDQTFLGATTGRRWKLFRPFVQDDWRVTDNLTVNIGLAWALTTPITEEQNRQANFDVASGKLLVAGNISIAGCTICQRSDSAAGITMDKTAFEPRIGIAWKPFGSQSTAVRAGYAIFHDSSWNQGAQGLFENPPYFAESDNFPNVPCPFNNATSANPLDCGIQRLFLPVITAPPNPSTFPGAVQSQNLDFKQGMVQQLNLNVEHQLGNVVLTAGYAGSRSTHILMDGLDFNINSPAACPGGSAPVAGYTFGCGYTKPISPFTHIVNNNDVGRARYDSLQLKAESRSTRHGLYFLLGYTWARTFDSGFSDGLGSFPGAIYWPLPGMDKADWSLSALNVNNTFTAGVIYDLPFGKGKNYGNNWNAAENAILGNWQINVIERALSGFPLFVVASGTSNASGVPFFWNSGPSFDRPDEVGDPNKGGPVAANPGCVAPAKVHTLTAWFNPCAFEQAPAGELGTAPRAPVSGPNFINTDFSIIKNFVLPFREGMGVQFRAEFFNLFNHAQFYLSGDGSFGQMQNIATPTSFGVVNATAGNPRVVQLALKLNF
jgi:Carboxypeptidase regulatory-like domain/TonB-dependent Receptor Plug Domain